MLRVSRESWGSLELSLLHSPDRDPTTDTLSDDQIRLAVIDDIIQKLAEPLGELTQELLNTLISILDHTHRDVLRLRPDCTSDSQESSDQPPKLWVRRSM